VSQEPDGEIVVELVVDGLAKTVRGDALLLATGRVPNSATMALNTTGVAVDERGYVVTDEYMRTTQPGIWGLAAVCTIVRVARYRQAESKVPSRPTTARRSVRTNGRSEPRLLVVWR